MAVRSHRTLANSDRLFREQRSTSDTSVPALPKRTQVSPPPVVLPGNGSLQSSHRPPERYGSGLDHKVVVVRHQTPREDRETIPVSDVAQRLQKEIRSCRIGKHAFASSHSAINVIGRVRDKKAGFPRHGRSFHARGRDRSILPPTAKRHNVIRGTDRNAESIPRFRRIALAYPIHHGDRYCTCKQTRTTSQSKKRSETPCSLGSLGRSRSDLPKEDVLILKHGVAGFGVPDKIRAIALKHA